MKICSGDSSENGCNRDRYTHPLAALRISSDRGQCASLMIDPVALLRFNHGHDAVCAIGDDCVELLQRPRRWKRAAPTNVDAQAVAVRLIWGLLGRRRISSRSGLCHSLDQLHAKSRKQPSWYRTGVAQGLSLIYEDSGMFHRFSRERPWLRKARSRVPVSVSW